MLENQWRSVSVDGVIYRVKLSYEPIDFDARYVRNGLQDPDLLEQVTDPEVLLELYEVGRVLLLTERLVGDEKGNILQDSSASTLSFLDELIKVIDLETARDALGIAFNAATQVAMLTLPGGTVKVASAADDLFEAFFELIALGSETAVRYMSMATLERFVERANSHISWLEDLLQHALNDDIIPDYSTKNAAMRLTAVPSLLQIAQATGHELVDLQERGFWEELADTLLAPILKDFVADRVGEGLQPLDYLLDVEPGTVIDGIKLGLTLGATATEMRTAAESIANAMNSIERSSLDVVTSTQKTQALSVFLARVEENDTDPAPEEIVPTQPKVSVVNPDRFDPEPVEQENGLLSVTPVTQVVDAGDEIPLLSLFPASDWSDRDGPYDIVSFAVQDRTAGGAYLMLDSIQLAHGVVYEAPTSSLSRWTVGGGDGLGVSEFGFNIIQADGDYSTKLTPGAFVNTRALVEDPDTPDLTPPQQVTDPEIIIDLDRDTSGALLEDEQFRFIVERRGSLDGDITIRWEVSGIGDNPTSNDDFNKTFGYITLRDGDDEQGFNVTPVRDQINENDERFKVDIDVIGADVDLVDDDSFGTILNDDSPLDPSVATDRHSDTQSSATLIAEDVWERGFIQTGGDVDWFRFDLRADVTYELRIVSDNDLSLVGGSKDKNADRLRDVDATLYLPGGGTLELEPTNIRTFWETPLFTPTADGTYYLRVRHPDGNDIGQYFVLPDIRVEKDDYSADASTEALLDIGSPFEFEHLRDEDEDWLGVPLEAGRSYKFMVMESRFYEKGEMAAGDGHRFFSWGDPDVSLKKADGTQVAAPATDTATDNDGYFEYTPTETGIYYLSVGEDFSLGSKVTAIVEEIKQPIEDAAQTILQPDETVSEDGYWYVRGGPDTTFQNTDTLQVGASPDATAALRFDTLAIGDVATFEAVWLELFVLDRESEDSLSLINLTISDSDWNESTSYSGLTTSSFLTVTPVAQVGEWMRFDVTNWWNLVQNEELLNYGFFLKQVSMHDPMTEFASSGYVTEELRPRLVFERTDPNAPIELDLSYVTTPQTVRIAEDRPHEVKLGVGDDIYIGGPSADYVYDFGGRDDMDGAGGVDTIDFSNASASVAAYLKMGAVFDTSGQGRLKNFENAIGTEFEDRLSGTEGSNTIWGGASRDVIKGKNGDDILHGGSGNDKVISGSGDDILTGGDGNDILAGLAGDDVLEGGLGEDSLYGGRDSDILSGGFGDDTLRGNRGNDTVNGSSGDDNINGGGGNDVLHGNADNDYLAGGGGIDRLDGGLGDDIMIGGRTRAEGGDGFEDVFVFGIDGADAGDDKIRDFELGVDMIDLSKLNLSSYDDVVAASTDFTSGVLLSFGDSGSLWVSNTSISDLTSLHFEF